MNNGNQSPCRSTLQVILPFFFFFLILACGIFWIRIDRSVWPFDQAWYGEVSLNLFSTLRDKPSEWWYGMTHAFRIKAPLIAWLGQFLVPLKSLVGRYENALLILPLMASAIAAAVAVRAAARLFNEQALPALIAGLTFTSASLCIGMSHEFFVEPMQLLVTSIFFLLLTSRSSGATLLTTGALWLILGMAAKISTPLYIFLPSVVLLYDCSKRIRQKPHLLSLIVLSLLTVGAAIICGAWYFINSKEILNFMRSSSGGPLAELYGSKGALSVKLVFWIEMFGVSFFNHRLGGYFWVGIFLIAFCARLIRKRAFTRSDIAAMCAGGQVAALILCLATQVNQETRYLLPLLPAVAIGSAFIISELRAISLVAIPLFSLKTAAVFAASFSITFPLLTFLPFSFSTWLHPANADSLQSEILHHVVTSTCNVEDGGRYNVIGHEIGIFNANSASFYMAQAVADKRIRNHCFYTSLGYAESDPRRSWKRIAELNTLYVVFRSDLQSLPGDPFNAVSPQIRAQVSKASNFTTTSNEKFPMVEFYRSSGFLESPQ